jgi:hypothetical protein
MTDYILPGIPAFLRRGTPENDRLLKEGAAHLAINPHRSSSVYKKKECLGQTKAQKKRINKSRDQAVRQQLLDVNYSKAFVSGLSITKARQIVADLVSGKGSTREDLI